MTRILLRSILLAIPLGVGAQTEDSQPKITAEESLRRASLALGYQEGVRAARKQMKAGDIDHTTFLEGFLLGIKGREHPLSPEEIREAMVSLQTKLTAREAATAASNLEAARKYLAANEKKQGIIRCKSGLQYRVKVAGKGEPYGDKELLGKDILVNFRGTLPDGREFASSGEIAPAKIQLDDVIAGFREALGLMPKGAKWTIYVPSELAYGEQRRSSEIGPNQLLIFEIELLDIIAPSPEAE